MIRYIKGNLIYKGDSYAVVENNGMGFKVNIPLSSTIYQESLGDAVEVFTSMIVKEDDISLYGFSNMEDLDLFQKLISVNGVGAKAGLSIFSALTSKDIRYAILTEDDKMLAKANGIGKKTAQRIVIDLKDKISSDQAVVKDETNQGVSNALSSNKEDAITALEDMGFPRYEIVNALNNIADDDLSIEEYIKRLLKHFA